MLQVEKIILNKARNVSLEIFIQDVGGEFSYITKRPAIIVIPGGGYQNCSDREAEPVAMPFLKAGYDVFILRYSIGKEAVWPNPLDDYEQAMSLILEKAEDWHIYKDKIAVIGFSAGGHLAAAAATMAQHRPAAAILGYAVIGEDSVKEWNPTAPGIIDYVDNKTCPCFLFATRTDELVPVQNTIDMMEALNKNQIMFEAHIYNYGPHGFSTADHSVQSPDTRISRRVAGWVEDSIEWLRDIFGDFGNGEMRKPAVGGYVRI